MLSTLITRIAGAASRRPKTTIALWLVFVAGCVFSGAMAGTNAISGADEEVGQTKQAERAMERANLDAPDIESVLVRSSSPATTRSAADALTQRLRATAGVTRVETAARRGPAQLVQATLKEGSDDALEARVEAVQREVAAVHKSHPGAQFLQTGDGSFGIAIDEMVGEDLAKAEMISLPLTLVILLLAFGAFVAASVPLLLGITSVAAALGVAGPLSQIFPADESASSLVVLIGLAVGVDYSLFYIRREREERRRGYGPQAALRAASAGVARAIAMSGATVIVAIAGLLITGMPMFMSMALSTMAVVAIAVLGSLTVLPAVLAKLGDKVDKGRIWRRRERRGEGRAWAALARGVTRRPLGALAIAGALLVTLAIPATQLSTGTTTLEGLPKDLAPAQAAIEIQKAFGREPDLGEIVVTGADLGDKRAGLVKLGRDAMRATGARGDVAVQVAADGRTALVEIPMASDDPDGAVRTIRSEVLPGAAALGPQTKAMLGGQAAGDLDFTSRLNTMTPIVVAIVLGLAFVLLVAAFRSAWLAAGVIGLNLLSIGAAYGVLVAVFQYDWAEGLLGFTSTGSVVDWVPLFCFVILFGLSMDYTIIVLERIREARLAGHDARAAVAEGLSATAGAVTSAAVVMVAVFAVFAALRLPDMKQLGVGLATAVLIDATIVRALALPALVTLLGERRWRVGSLRRNARHLRPSPARG
ncbi:MAG TPA: MMPL family transporter [Solirubrobacteraceae bacterium]